MTNLPMRKLEHMHVYGELSFKNKLKLILGSFSYFYEQCVICGKVRLRRMW